MNAGPLESLPVKWVILILLGSLWHAAPAAAHKAVVFATVQGSTMEGEAYFRGGTPIRGAKVTVVGPDEQLLGETTTDEEGKFTLDVRLRCDHRLVVEAGEGHGAEYTVSADELPDDLPKPGAPAGLAGGERGQTGPAPPAEGAGEPAAAPPAEKPAAVPDRQELEREIAAVGKQIAALRKDLDKYKNQLRLQDILGGIGYILGIMGLAFYFLGVRRKEKRSEAADSPSERSSRAQP